MAVKIKRSLTIKIDHHVLEVLEEMAKLQRRSFPRQIAHFLEQAIYLEEKICALKARSRPVASNTSTKAKIIPFPGRAICTG